jgi:uncharacterized protein (TIGR03437 family)
MVRLDPSVKVADVDATIESLESKYGVRKHPTLLVDRELATGAYFVVLGTDAQAAALSQDPLVRLVERDRQVVISPTLGKKKRSPKGSRTKASPKAVAPKVLQSVPYQLDRSDQRDLPLNNQVVRPNNGDEVDIYHIGSHPWMGHTEFAQPLNPSRNIGVFTSYEGTLITGCEFAVNTHSQHDTGVLSIAAGNNFGMAPLSNLVVYAVIKDLGNIPTSYQTTVTNALIAIRNRINANRPRGAIVFMTSGVGGFTSSIDATLDSIFDNADTFFIAAAAGLTYANGSQSDRWPQRHQRVLKVGPSNISDVECSLENFSCDATVYYPAPIQMWAPADDVNVATVGPCAGGQPIFSDYALKFGSSFAAPLVTGNASIFIGANTTYYPHWYHVQEALLAMASKDKLDLRPNTFGIANALTYNFRRALPVSLNAASYLPTAARGSIVASFGDYGFAPNHMYLKYECGPFCGSTVEQYTFQPSNSSQVNWAVADNTPVGTHLVTVTYTSPPFSEALLGDGILKVVDVKPGFFTYNSSGTGTVSGWIYKYNKVTGAFEGQAQLTLTGQGTLWNSATQNAVLSLYGTGWRNGGTPTLTVNGINVGVMWSGASPCCIGLDQVNSNFQPDSLNTAGTKTILLTSQGVNNQPNVTVTFSP